MKPKMNFAICKKCPHMYKSPSYFLCNVPNNDNVICYTLAQKDQNDVVIAFNDKFELPKNCVYLLEQTLTGTANDA